MPHRLYCEVHASDFEERVQHRDIIDLHQFYCKLQKDGAVPLLVDFDVATLPKFAPFLMRLEPTGDGSYCYSYYGSGIRDVAGLDMQGKSTSDFEGPLRAFFEGAYARVIASRAPLFTIHRSIRANLVHTWERLILPVQREDGEVAFIVYNRPREFQQDFLQAIMNVLSDGIVALGSVRTASGEPCGAVVHTANPAARTLLMAESADIEGLTLEALMAPCAGLDLWPTVQDVIMSRQMRIHEAAIERDGATRFLRFQITPLFDGALMHISDITMLKMANVVLERERQQLHHEISRQRSEGDILRGLVHLDPMTGALNRRGLFAAAQEWAARLGPRSVIAVDVDCFKQVNDRHGHGLGDDVIRHVASVLFDLANEMCGFVSRLGGDELVCVLPLPVGEAEAAAQAARIRIATAPVAGALGPVMVTCSFGVAPWGEAGNFDAAMHEADRALYAAKQAGRNRVRQAGDVFATCAGVQPASRGAA